MKNAFDWHGKSCNALPPSDHEQIQSLLLCYAVECGLKYCLMDERNYSSYDAVPFQERIGHDLRLGLEMLKASREVVDLLNVNFRTSQKPPQQVDSSRLHEAFRYGIKLEDEKKVSEALRKVLNWVKGRVGR